MSRDKVLKTILFTKAKFFALSSYITTYIRRENNVIISILTFSRAPFIPVKRSTDMEDNSAIELIDV